MDNTALANRSNGGMTRIKNYMTSPEVKERFAEMMGANAIYYLNQVLILVANDAKLQECEPQSILVAAMRAASLRLSVDVSSGQAWIIPYRDNRDGGKMKAQFQLGYKGVYELAQRTNKYRFINVIEIFEGEELQVNRMTGLHTIHGKPTPGKKPVTIAWMLYFQLAVSGFEKTYPMTVKEIADHANRYAHANYVNPKSKWNDEHERPKMEMKTVLMNGLRKWGVFNESDKAIIEKVESEQGWIDAADNAGELPEESAVTPPVEAPKRSEAEIMGDLYGDPAPAAPAKTAVPAANAKNGDAPAPADTANTSGAAPRMSLETAYTVKNTAGTLYKNVTDENLETMLKQLRAVPNPGEEILFKIEAVEVIQAHRASQQK